MSKPAHKLYFNAPDYVNVVIELVQFVVYLIAKVVPGAASVCDGPMILRRIRARVG